MTVQEATSPDTWLQSKWSGTKSAVLADLTRDVQNAIETEWFDIAGRAPEGDIPAAYRLAARANQHAARRADELAGSLVNTAFDEGAITLKARRLARHCLCSESLAYMCRLAEAEGIEPPDVTKHSEPSQKRRLQCEKWWRRRLRLHMVRRAENKLRELGLIHKNAGLYCTDATLRRRQDQKSRQRDFLQEVAAINSLGESFSLLDLVETSVSNKALRRAELMTRIAGFEALAAEAGHRAEFLTMTAPSRFHARYSDGRPNPMYQAGNDPRASQRFLCEVWARIRAKLAREGIAVYGFRIAEPHHDATTHWHLLLFVQPEDTQRLREICRGYLLADSGDEPGAAKHRFKAVSVDPNKGSAAGYVAKYVAKNIDGFEVGQDLESDSANALETAARVDAWASTWGIRQFQQIGGPPVGVWRECRRLREPIDDEVFEGIRAAADAGDWAGFVEALGGVLRGRDVPVTLEKQLTGELNDYGELKGEVIVGVRCGAAVILTREVAWIFLWVGNSEAPWTCVNNCTRSVTASDRLLAAGRLNRGPPAIDVTTRGA